MVNCIVYVITKYTKEDGFEPWKIFTMESVAKRYCEDKSNVNVCYTYHPLTILQNDD